MLARCALSLSCTFARRPYLFVDTQPPQASSTARTYLACVDAVSVSALNCWPFLLWRLPDSPRCEDVEGAFAYCMEGWTPPEWERFAADRPEV